jgi:hypothetical protein
MRALPILIVVIIALVVILINIKQPTDDQAEDI